MVPEIVAKRVRIIMGFVNWGSSSWEVLKGGCRCGDQSVVIIKRSE